MRTISDFMVETKINESINEINLEIISESLSDPKLIELATFLKAFGSKNKRQYGNRSFSGIFGQYMVEWDKIKESDWQEFEGTDPNAKKTVRRCISNRDNAIYGLTLVSEKDSDKVRYLIAPNGGVIDFKAKKYVWNAGNTEEKIEPKDVVGPYAKQYETLEFLENAQKIWVLDLRKFDNSAIRRKRNAEKDGMILQGDLDFYQKLARENVERYKKIIAKAKAEEQAKNDTIAKDVQDIVNKALDLSVKAAADPVKYADVSFDISWNIEKIYSTAHYDKGRTIGSDGLLFLFKTYLSYLMDTAKNGGYNFQRNSINEYKKKVEKQIALIKADLERIESKINQ